MTRVKNLWCACLLGLLLLSAGCNMTSEQRLDLLERYIDTATDASQDIGQALVVLDHVAEQTQLALEDPNLPASEVENVREILTKTRAEIVKLQARKTQIDEALARWQEVLVKAQAGEVNVATELQVLGEGTRILGGEIGGSIGGYVTIAGMVLSGIAGLIGGLIKNAKTQHTLEDVVTSVSALLSNGLVTDEEQAKKVLERTQLPPTRASVKKIIGTSDNAT